MKFLLWLLSGLFVSVPLLSQTNSLGLPSPNNSFLGNIGGGSGIGVDLYTGTAQVNIPICNLPGREMTIPVSLNYTAGRGVKLQEYAGSAGLGWQLNAGGSITRVVRGFPDEFPNGYLGTDLIGQKIEAYYNGSGSFPAGVNNGLNVPTKDGEPDIYFVRTPFFSFQFTFDGNGNPVFNNETGVQISSYNFFNSSSYPYSTFIVRDPAGNTYNFGAYKETSTASLYGTNHTFNTTWYLGSIISFNSKDNIGFEYLSSTNNDQLPHYQKTRTGNYFGCYDDNTDPVSLTINQPKYISRILTSTGQIDFSYQYDRSDISTAARLTGIVLKSDDGQGTGFTTLQSYSFSHSYFGLPSTDPKRLRLKLDKITVAGGTTATSTPMDYKTFTYNTAENLPARDDQTFDYWGFYTSFPPSTDPMNNPTIRVPNEARTKANILTQVKELGGGNWVIDYEQNNYYKTSGGTNANVAVGGLRVKSIAQTLATGEHLQTDYVYHDNTGKSTGQILTEAYANLVLLIGGLQRVFSESPANIYDINGTFTGYSTVKTLYQNGGYILSEFANFSDHADVFDYADPSHATTAPAMISSISFAFRRGLPKKITEYSAADVKISESVNTYTSLTSPAARKSWAFRWYVAAASACSQSSASTMHSRYYVNVDNYRLTATTVRQFDQQTPANAIERTTNYTYCTNNRTIKTISTTDSKGNTVSRTQYHSHDLSIPMVTTPEQLAINSLVSGNNLDAMVHEERNNNGAIAQSHNIWGKEQGSEKVYLKGTAAYKGSTLLTTQEYVYETAYSNLVASSVTGGKPESVMYGYGVHGNYPVARISNAATFYEQEQGIGSFGDYFTGSSYSTSFVVDFTGDIGWSLYPAGFSGSATIYYTLSGQDYRSGSFCLYGSGCSSYGTELWSNMAPGTYYISFYVSGSFTGALYLTGAYPKLNPVLRKEFFYQSFEEITYGNSVMGAAHTGNRYWNASVTPYAVNFTPPNNRSYIMQWWNWDNGKWKFNEVPYTGPRTISGVIDDIRIFPQDAAMTTSTYFPLVGQTGVTDASGRTVITEYDGLQRVNIVRDNEHNILSKNCYNYLGQPVDCPTATVYTNTEKTGSFTRNNCPPGYVGQTVTYTVAAGTYSSSLSQADADQQAINDVNTKGQSYANTIACIQTWFNVEKTGSFTRNNCGSGYTPSGPVVYTVQAGTYASNISQADADQKAQDDVNANGQAFANANSTCIGGPCSFSMISGFSSPTNNISASGSTVSFYIVFYSTSGNLTAGNTYTIANVNGSCIPSGNRTFNITSGSTYWEVTFLSNGNVQARLLSGTLNAGNSAYFSTSYSL